MKIPTRKKEEQSVRAEEKTQEIAEPEKVAEVPATEPETHGNEAAAHCGIARGCSEHRRGIREKG